MPRPEGSGWQRDQGAEKLENAFDRQPGEAEGQQDEPHERIEEEREKCNWPAEKKEN